MSETPGYSLFSGNSCRSKDFFDFDSSYKKTGRSEEDIYEMALEVLEADEAFRLESSGSVSPESDVDRLLENADTERYSGDATLLRIFSILQNDNDNDDAFRATINSVERFAEVEEMTQILPSSEVLVFSAPDGSREDGRRDEVIWTTREEDPGKVSSEPNIRGFRLSELCRAFDSVDLLSVDLTNESDSVGSDVPRRSKEARIRTHASRDRNDDAFGDETDSDVSLHVTSSDSLYSTTEDCFADDSVLVDLKSRYFSAGTWNTYTTTSSDDVSASAFRQPSPEDLFDEALETRSDLAASVESSGARVSPPPYAYFDAVECSPACGHRGPSPEDEFDLALETLSDAAVDDSSSSVFFVVATPRSTRSDPRKQPAADSLPANGGREADSTAEDDPDFRKLDGSSRRSSCEAVADNDDDDPSHPGRYPLSVAAADPLNALDDLLLGRQESKDCTYLNPWSSSMSSSSDCPCSSPEPSYLAEYSTDDDDDCVGGESDSLTDDNDASSGIEESTGTSFFRRLLRRKEFRETMDLWGGGRGGGTNLLDDIRICSIEDLLTDSENERDFHKVRTAVAAAPPIDVRSPVTPVSLSGAGGVGQDPRKKVSEECHRAADVPVSLSPPIVLAARADVQFARNNKIPRLPESTPPVRVSW